MGPVNWLAVLLGANLAGVVGIFWYGVLFRGDRPLLAGPGARWKSYARALIVALIVATLIGHNFARIGPATLAAKPWLYWMMSGGFALFIAAPVLYFGLARHGVALGDRLIDCGYWIVAFLAIGTTFWALR